MIYLDSAATSLLKPSSVEQAMVNAVRTMASPGRGGHSASMRAAELVYACREAAAEMFSLDDPSNAVFTLNATHALNIAINSLVRPGSRVLVSGFEHNSVTRPLRAMGAEIVTAGTKLFDRSSALEEFALLIPTVELVVCTHVSNVFGYILPVYEIGAMCRRAGVPFVVDASQSAGVLPVDMKKLRADFVAMPGHKGLMGPQGTGILLCAGRAKPLLHGGSGSDSISQQMPELLPDMLEAGTHNVCGIAGLLAGMEYVREKGTEAILAHERRLMLIMAEELSRTGLELFCSGDVQQSGVLSVRADNINCEELASRLAEQGICVRAGLHCAPFAHKSAGTLRSGTVRLSFSPFISENQVKSASSVIKQIINNA